MAVEQFFNAVIRRKDGLSSMQSFARRICIIARWAAPIIQTKYPFNLPLMAALEAAKAACEQLDLAIEQQRQYNAENPHTGFAPPVAPPSGGPGDVPPGEEPDPEE